MDQGDAALFVQHYRPCYPSRPRVRLWYYWLLRRSCRPEFVIEDPSISSRFRPEVLDQARERYSIAADSIRLLDGFESFMYEFDRADGRFILRLSHSLRRSPDQIRGEVDWINYLYAGGVNVARAVLSRRGNLVEPVDDGQGGEFLCTAFTWASGEHMERRAPVRPDVRQLRPPARTDARAGQEIHRPRPGLEAPGMAQPAEPAHRPVVRRETGALAKSISRWWPVFPPCPGTWIRTA